jgi:hypothetical protein
MKNKLVSGVKFFGAAVVAAIFVVLYCIGAALNIVGDAVSAIGRGLKTAADCLYYSIGPSL